MYIIVLNKLNVLMEKKNYIGPLQIGSLQTCHNLVLAPLAGITDYPFRRICRDFGADLTFTEMVSVDGLHYGNAATTRLLQIRKNERPIGIQLFGSEPEAFDRILPDLEKLAPQVVDLNFGCPVRKVVKRGAGAALLRDLGKLEKIVSVVKNLPFPVMAKIRIGWNAEQIVAVEAALAAQSGGADAVTVHGRTRNQGYSGKADWEQIARVKTALSIPVIGNGDVFDAESARRMFEVTGVDGIMIARGALGRPWIFREILEILGEARTFNEPDFHSRVEVLREHYRMQLEINGEDNGLNKMKKHFVWYTRGLPHAAHLRDQIFRAGSSNQIFELLSAYGQRYPEGSERISQKVA